MEDKNGDSCKATLILSGGITFSGTMFGAKKPVDGEIGMFAAYIHIYIIFNQYYIV
jgi:hypothetical protein